LRARADPFGNKRGPGGLEFIDVFDNRWPTRTSANPSCEIVGTRRRGLRSRELGRLKIAAVKRQHLQLIGDTSVLECEAKRATRTASPKQHEDKRHGKTSQNNQLLRPHVLGKERVEFGAGAAPARPSNFPALQSALQPG